MHDSPPGSCCAHLGILVLLAALSSGCTFLQPRPDQLFAAGQYPAAAAAYQDYLATGRAEGIRHERALYRLGLIHARQNSDLYDPVAARRYLERLLAVEPPSRYAVQAAVILDLQLEVNRLRTAMADQRGLARLLLDELHRLRSEAERIESQASDEQQRARALAGRIDELRRQMEALASELEEREEELERLKRIDLEDPPK